MNFFKLFLLFVCYAAGLAEAGAKGKAWFTDYDAVQFSKLVKASEPIDPAKLDRALLDAAVFHETNHRRQKHQLLPLAFDNRAWQLAQMQSKAMAGQAQVSHEHPEPDKKTLSDRARTIGLRTAFLAENVASTFGRQYRSGDKFYVRERFGKKIVSYEPKGPPIPRHTYLSFAEALLDQWMDSLAHRKNILHAAPLYLGAACEPGQTDTPLTKFYCTQVFLTPRDETQKNGAVIPRR
jgi:uncharacterized protein YkwD